jgi:short-subunit dehydrogenase
VVTGASDGIGAEFAVQLADAGFNIVLVARSYEKLSEIASRIADRAFFDLVTPSCLKFDLSQVLLQRERPCLPKSTS